MKKDTKLILIVLAGILAIVLLCIFAVQGTQNKAFILEEQVNTAQSDIRVQEKRRVDPSSIKFCDEKNAVLCEMSKTP